MVVTLGQQYNIGEKATVILYTYCTNHHAQPPIISQHTHCTVVEHSYEDDSNNIDNSTIEPYKNIGAWVNRKM